MLDAVEAAEKGSHSRSLNKIFSMTAFLLSFTDNSLDPVYSHLSI